MFGNDDKTEDPTPRKLEKALEQGDVAQSAELSSGIQVLAFAAALSALGAPLFSGLAFNLQHTFTLALPAAPGTLTTPDAVSEFVSGTLARGFSSVLPLLATLAVAALLANLLHRRPTWAPGKLAPKAQRFSPSQNLKKSFSGEGLSRLGLTLFKLAAAVAIVAVMLMEMTPLRSVAEAGLASGLGQVGGVAQTLLFGTGLVLLVVGAGDLFLAHKRHLDQLRMTKQEVRDEHKEDEGDPYVKGRRRQLQRAARSQAGMLEKVAEADVVITNPTHYAVALKYDRGSMAAPVLLAKGVDHLAARIRERARQEGVTMLANPPLTRLIYKTVKVGAPIPPDLYEAVAEILAFVYRLRGKAGQAGKA
ncbi:MAG: EscU/YscU/HrcU family type III secretion system export apparatus switch protein [Planctomycetota bacterium]